MLIDVPPDFWTREESLMSSSEVPSSMQRQSDFSVSEERYVDPETGGEKGKKLEEYSLIPVGPLAEVARVYGLGAKKYANRNWEKSYPWSLSFSAMQRHIQKFWSGESYDEESGQHHLAHAVFHCLAMMEWETQHPETDDRPKTASTVVSVREHHATVSARNADMAHQSPVRPATE